MGIKLVGLMCDEPGEDACVADERVMGTFATLENDEARRISTRTKVALAAYL